MQPLRGMTPSGIVVVHPKDCKTFIGDGRLTKVLIDRDSGVQGASLAWVTIPPGGSYGPHKKAAETEIVFVVSGRLKLTTEHGSVTLEAGDAAAVPPQTAHAHFNDGADWNRYLIIHTPDGPEQEFRHRPTLERSS